MGALIRSDTFQFFGAEKSNLKKSLIGGPEIDMFEPIFGFLMQFWYAMGVCTQVVTLNDFQALRT